MSETNYKAKYKELKSKFMSSVDTAFRLGYEQGAQDAQMEQMQQQAQQQAEQDAMAQQQATGGSEPGNPGQDDNEQSPGMPGQVPEPGQDEDPSSAHPDGSELDQHIAKLEGMLGKGEISASDLQKTVGAIKEFKNLLALNKSKAQFNHEMKKSTAVIPAIAKALHRPAFKIGKQASANMNDSDKRAVSMQEKIVSDIFKTWEKQETKTSNSIADIINVEGLTKGE